MTKEMSRRDVVKFAAALAVGAGTATVNSASAQPLSKPADVTEAGERADDLLERAKQSPESFMLSEPEIIALDTDARSRELVITSAINEKGDQVNVRVRSRSVRIFRADPTVDEFTSQGGIYWRFREKSGKAKLKESSGAELFNQLSRFGPIVMVVRDNETVRVYTMTPDLRC